MNKEEIEEMSESELKKELKNIYQEINDISNKEMQELSFEGEIVLEKKNSDGEVVKTVEADI